MLYLKSFYYLVSAGFVLICFFAGVEKYKEKTNFDLIRFSYSEITLDSVITKLNLMMETRSVEEAVPLYLSFRELYKEIEPEFYYYNSDAWEKINSENLLGNLEKSIFRTEESTQKLKQICARFRDQLTAINTTPFLSELNSNQFFILKYKLCTYHLIKGQDSPVMDLNHSEALDGYQVLSLMTKFQEVVSYNNIELEEFLNLSIEIIDISEPENRKTEINQEMMSLYQQILEAEEEALASESSFDTDLLEFKSI